MQISVEHAKHLVRVRTGRFSNFLYTSRRGVSGLHCAFTSRHIVVATIVVLSSSLWPLLPSPPSSFDNNFNKESTAVDTDQETEVKKQKINSTTNPTILYITNKQGYFFVKNGFSVCDIYTEWTTGAAISILRNIRVSRAQCSDAGVTRVLLAPVVVLPSRALSNFTFGISGI